MTTTMELIKALSNAVGVAGRENKAAQLAARLLEPYGKVETTVLGSVICTLQAPKQGQAHLLLDAHLDEIGMIVSYIDEKGFLTVSNCGGVDRRLLSAAQVVVHTKEEDLYGVVCSIPPHLSSDSDKVAKIEDLHIDVGLSGIQAKQRIALGDRVTILSTARELIGEKICGKALDNRASCAALIRTAQLLEGKELPCGVSILLSTMEEVGGQGAKTAAYQLMPTHAVVVDVSFAHTPDAPRHKCGDLNKGPMIGIAPLLNKQLTELLQAVCQREGIPFQSEVMGGETGTNADAIAVTGAGVKTAMASIPQRYMHTPIEVVSAQDVEDTARLLAGVILSGEIA